MGKLVAVVALALTAGCYDLTPVANQDEATAVIWNGFYGETRSPPAVDWMRNGRTGILSSGAINGEYENGYYDLTYIHVVVPDPAWYTYAHELYHAHLFYSTGNADPEHSDSQWGTIDGKASAALQLMRVHGPTE
jgi:hypothetical protein